MYESILLGGPTTKPVPEGNLSQSSATITPPAKPADVSAPSQPSSNPGPPPAPTTILEALEQRLEKYQSAVQDAEKEENAGKARRMKRIVKVVMAGDIDINTSALLTRLRRALSKMIYLLFSLL